MSIKFNISSQFLIKIRLIHWGNYIQLYNIIIYFYGASDNNKFQKFIFSQPIYNWVYNHYCLNLLL